MEKQKKPQPKYWYKIFVGECPVCGSSKSYRERMHTPRPENREDRYEYLPDSFTYDHCVD